MKKTRIIIISTIILVVAIILCFIIVKKDELFNTQKDELIKYNDTEYVAVDDGNILSYQKNISNSLQKDFNIEDYSFSTPLIKINPYEVSPLTALIAFKTSEETKIILTLKGKNNNDIVWEFEKATNHYIPVYGLYSDYANKIIIEDENNNKKEIVIQTENIVEKYNISNELLTMQVEKNNIGLRNEFYFISSPLESRTFAYDTYGELRWVILNNNYKEFTMLENGNLLLSSAPVANKEVVNTDLVEMDLFGKIHNYYRIENGYHNDFVTLENGNVLMVSNENYKSFSGDLIVELDLSTGKIVKSFPIGKLLKSIDKEFIEEYGDSWDFNSGIDFDEDNNAIILSYWEHGTVISVDYKTGKINWMFGNPDVWSSKFKSYFLKLSGSSEYAYPLSIQAAKITSKNNLSLFDNGFDIYAENNKCSDVEKNVSSIVDYKINYSAKTIELVQRRLQNEGYFSYALGDYDKKYDNEVILFGREFVNPNVNDANCTVYDHQDWSSYLIELNENEVVYKAKFNAASYRVSLLNMYKSKSNYDFADVSLFNLDKAESNKKMESFKKEISAAQTNDEAGYNISVVEGRIGINALFINDDVVNVILVNKYGEGYKFAYKISGKSTTEKVNLSSFNDRFFIYLEVNGVVYNLKQYIDL